MDKWAAAALLVLGFGLKSAIDVVLELLSNRPRVATTARNYFRPCRNCTIRSASRIGERLRPDAVIRRAAAAVHRRLQRAH